MDWTSEDGRSLLWKAYPDGYLARRGVLTVGGWTYLGERCWAAPSSSMVQGWDSVRYPGHALSCGDLLPLPDPSDSATWACLLEDLSSACGHPAGIFWNIDPSGDPNHFAWRGQPGQRTVPLGWTHWQIRSAVAPSSFGNHQTPVVTDYWRTFSFSEPVLGSAAALVRARILLREEAEGAEEANP